MDLKRPTTAGVDRLIDVYAVTHGAEPGALRITHDQHARLAAEWGRTPSQMLMYRGIRIRPSDPITPPESQSP